VYVEEPFVTGVGSNVDTGEGKLGFTVSRMRTYILHFSPSPLHNFDSVVVQHGAALVA
jgi:hypothetical protein